MTTFDLNTTLVAIICRATNYPVATYRPGITKPLPIMSSQSYRTRGELATASSLGGRLTLGNFVSLYHVVFNQRCYLIWSDSVLRRVLRILASDVLEAILPYV